MVAATLLASSPLLGAARTVTSSLTLNQDHRGSIVIKADDVTLDCGGHTILWNGSSNAAKCVDRYGTSVTCGIKVSGYDNVTIRDCVVLDERYAFGIWVADAVDPLLAENETYFAPAAGIHLIRTDGAYVRDSVSSYNLEGVEMFDNLGAFLYNNAFVNNVDAGIDEEWGSENTFYGNYASGNYYGFFGWQTYRDYLAGNRFRVNGFIGTILNYSEGFLIDGDDDGANGQYGIAISTSRLGTINRCTAKLNSVCDAYQDRATTQSIAWTSNTFTKRCGLP